MTESTDNLIESILRGVIHPFSISEFVAFLKQVKIQATKSDAELYLQTHPLVFQLSKTKYITRAGIFTNEIFSIKPTRFEVQNQVLFIGDRCFPFIDPDMMPVAMSFFFHDTKLAAVPMQIDRNFALQLYQLVGEEYAAQYIASDPLNNKLDLAATDFELPSTVSLTGFSLKEIIEESGFQYGDRLLLRLLEWNEGIIDIEPIIAKKSDVFAAGSERMEWMQNFEKYLLESFDLYGPCSSMEEQLANVYVDYKRELCVRNCASIEEFLGWTKKIDIAYFGVESRLWRRGEEIPAIGEWNRIEDDEAFFEDKRAEYGVPDYVLDSFITDVLYEKKEDFSVVAKRVFPPQVKIMPHEEKRVLLQIKERGDIIRKDYNWFADFEIGAVRHRALALYERVNELIYDVDCASDQLDKFPQNQLVILSQLFGHLNHILQSLFSDPNGAAKEKDSIMLSLEGMEYNFEEIHGDIAAAIADMHRSGFKVM